MDTSGTKEEATDCEMEVSQDLSEKIFQLEL